MKILRYTSLPILLDMLIKKRLVLLNPSSWEDRNDTFFIEKYRELKNMKTVLAICFTTKPQTYHHWKIYAGNSSGVCIQFDRDKLVSCLKHDTNIKHDMVNYQRVKKLRKNLPPQDKLPFFKRKQYEGEAEFRIIYENEFESYQTKAFEFDIASILSITMSPWMPLEVYNTVKNVLKNIPGCRKIEIKRTGLIEYERWKNIAVKVCRK